MVIYTGRYFCQHKFSPGWFAIRKLVLNGSQDLAVTQPAIRLNPKRKFLIKMSLPAATDNRGTKSHLSRGQIRFIGFALLIFCRLYAIYVTGTNWCQVDISRFMESESFNYQT